MKVFSVVSEYECEDSDEIRTQRMFVTHDANAIAAVTKDLCEEIESTGGVVKSVEEVLTICAHYKDKS